MSEPQGTMSHYLLTPCPKCGLPLTFPGMPSVDYVIEGLIARTGGKCPECGEQVVVDQEPPREVAPMNMLTEATTIDEIRAFPIVDLPLPLRCRLAITTLGVCNLGELFDLTRPIVRERLAEHPSYIEDIERLFNEHAIEW